ncbi:MAG TPA: pantoate--beta-alanine ligase, partial [Spirochaetota bacterium]|nr:pantoate--beta-alanine ligase [Spirochaetota bacterium]
PTQFGPDEDLNKYPRDLDTDKKLLQQSGVDLLFFPSDKEMYSDNHSTWVKNSREARILCGRSRPGHFTGVLTIVLKLLHIVRPGCAYFGKKDFQQLFLIKKMTVDLNLPVIIKSLPIVREKTGLALSSRNDYFTPADRAQAAFVYRILSALREQVIQGNIMKYKDLLKFVKKKIKLDKPAKLDYFKIVDKRTLHIVNRADQWAVLLIAVYFKGVRLIDNIEIKDD